MSTARRGRSASRKEEGNLAMGPEWTGPTGTMLREARWAEDDRRHVISLARGT